MSKTLVLLTISIMGCQGYDRELDFDRGDCAAYMFYDLTQYESYLVQWSGTPFTFWCIVSFHGENYYNVETKYRVCFKTLDYNFDGCDTTIRFIDGLLNDNGDKYDCNNPIPDKWCTEYDDYAKLKIETDYKTPSKSRLKLEVTVTADVSLSNAGALGIAFGCLAFIGIVTTVCIICVCKRNQRPNTSGTVFRTQQVPPGTPYQGQQVVGYSTQQPEMIPAGRDTYRQGENTIQQTTRMQPNPQPQIFYTSQPQSAFSSNSNTKNPQQYSQYSDDIPTPSAPPPSYDSLTDT